ncbi:MAG: CvpA family protein [Anaerolineae bacterium]
MNWLDLVIIAMIGWLTLTSLRNGLIREAFTLVGFGAGVFVAGQYYLDGAAWLGKLLGDVNYANAISFLAIMLTVWAAVSFVAGILRRVTHMLFLGWLDHLGGLLFGLVRAVIVVEALIIIFSRYPVLGLDEVIKDSLIGSFFLRSIPFLLDILPEEFDVLRYLPLE